MYEYFIENMKRLQVSNESNFTDEYILELQEELYKYKQVIDKIKEILKSSQFEIYKYDKKIMTLNFKDTDLGADILEILEDLDE